jgi:hypothetical protein
MAVPGSARPSDQTCVQKYWLTEFCVVVFCVQIDVERFMSDGQRLAEVIQAVKLQHQQEQLQELLES